MKLKAKTIARLNTRNLEEAFPRAQGEQDDAYINRLISQQIVTVDPEDTDAATIIVRFDLNLVWAVRNMDAPNLLTLLRSVLPSAASFATFSLNGLALPSSVFSSATDIAAVIRQMIETPEPVPKNLRLRVASEPVDAAEHYTLTTTLVGASRTSDDGSNEHACIPIMKFRYMAERKSDSHFNAGLNDTLMIDADYDFACLSVQPQMTASAELRAQLQTDGDVVLLSGGLISLPTVSAVSIHYLEFEFRRCVPGPTGAQPPKPPVNHHTGGSAVPEPPGPPDPAPPF